MQTEKEGLYLTILKLFPGIISIITILAGSMGLFKGQNKYYTVPIFIFLIGTHLFFSVKYKLANRYLFILYVSIAIAVILISLKF